MAEQVLGSPGSRTIGPPNRLWIAAGCVAAVILALSVVFASILFVSHVAGRPIDYGEPVYLREIVILLDSTESMDPDVKGGPAVNFEASKSKVLEAIFPHLGPGDSVSCYAIRSEFDESRNRVFGGRSLPGIPSLFAENTSGLTALPEVLVKLQRESEALMWDAEDSWRSKLESLERQEGGTSNYLAALAYAAERFRSVNASREVERILIVIGDRQQTPKLDPYLPPPASPLDRGAFRGVDVRLVYPYRSGGGTTVADAEQFWRKYFADRGNSRITATPFGDPSPLLSGNVLKASAPQFSRLSRR
jgi:hypothetical protein